MDTPSQRFCSSSRSFSSSSGRHQGRVQQGDDFRLPWHQPGARRIPQSAPLVRPPEAWEIMRHSTLVCNHLPRQRQHRLSVEAIRQVAAMGTHILAPTASLCYTLPTWPVGWLRCMTHAVTEWECKEVMVKASEWGRILSPIIARQPGREVLPLRHDSRAGRGLRLGGIR